MHRILIAGSLVIGALAGCSSGSEKQPESPVSIGAKSPGAAPALTQVGVPPADRRQLLLAQEKLTQKCMTRAGFKYTFRFSSERNTRRERPIWERSDDVEKARTEGYGRLRKLKDANLAIAAQGSLKNPDLADLSSAEQDRYQKQLFGTKRVTTTAEFNKGLEVPANGCSADAVKELYGDPVEWAALSDFADNLHLQIVNIVEKDPKIVGLIKEWSACMNRKGFRFRDPMEASNSISYGSRGQGGRTVDLPANPSKQEIDTAIAHAECDKQVGLSVTAEARVVTATAEVIKKYEPQLLAYKEKQSAALTKAAAILK